MRLLRCDDAVPIGVVIYLADIVAMFVVCDCICDNVAAVRGQGVAGGRGWVYVVCGARRLLLAVVVATARGSGEAAGEMTMIQIFHFRSEVRR